MHTFKSTSRILAAVLSVVVGLLVATAPPAAAVTPAATIKYLEVEAGSPATLKLSWDHVGGTIDSYQILYRAVGTTSWIWSSTSSVGSDYASWVPYVSGQSTYTREFRATGLSAGQSYEVTVATVATSGELSDREQSKVAVKTNPQIGALSTSATSAGDLTVSWPTYSATPFLQYDVYLGEGNVTPSWKTYKSTIGTTSHTFTGLTPGALYTVGVRVTQSQARVNNLPVKWVRSELKTTTRRVPSNEFFYSNAPHAFVSTTSDSPFVANGANLRRAAYKTNGVWQTDPYVTEEVVAMGSPNSPAFNTVRIAMDWPYFQKKVGSSVVIDTQAFAELDKIIDEAVDQGLYVILDPLHTANLGTADEQPSGRCTEDPVMVGAHRDIPAWLWTAIGETPGTWCDTNANWQNKMDNALARQETADYLKFVLNRYNGSTARGKQVIAVDLVNEPKADGASSPAVTQNLIDNVYANWLAPSGSKSLRATDPDKVLIVEPEGGSGSLIGVNLNAVAKPNVLMSFHDYFGRALSTDATYGIGYGGSGYSNQKEDTDGKLAGGGPYNPSTLSYATRKTQHTAFVQQAVDQAGAANMALYVGEYGIINPCNEGTLAFATQYAKDAYAIYQGMSLSRAVWSHGNWDDMAIWWREAGSCGSTSSKTYFPYAKELTGGVTH